MPVIGIALEIVLAKIHREAYPEVPPRVEYSLTDLTKELIPNVQTLINWANQHAEELTEKWEK